MSGDGATARGREPVAVIRRAVPADIDAVASLAMLRTPGDHDTWSGRFRTDLVTPDRALWVADCGEIVAYGRVRHFRSVPEARNTAPDGYYLLGLVVAPQHRRRGIGRAITQARLRWIADRANEAWYFTNAQNDASLHLHQELGFREITRDFVYPGVSFYGGVGVLCSVQLPHDR